MENAEYPFTYPGITVEEFEKEQRYYALNYDKVIDGTYKPLWKQKS